LIDKICRAVFAVGDDKKIGKGRKRRGGKEREGTLHVSHNTLYFRYLWGGHPWADSHEIWLACGTSRPSSRRRHTLIKISNFVIKFQGFQIYRVKIPIFSFSLLTIVTTVLRYRGACDTLIKQQ